MDKPYHIVETQEFQEQVLEVLGDIEVWDLLKEQLDFVIARNPYVRLDVSGHLLRLEVDDDTQTVTYKELE